MPQVSINIANRTYELACGEGEQDRVHELAAYVDEKISALRKVRLSWIRSMSGKGEARWGGSTMGRGS